MPEDAEAGRLVGDPVDAEDDDSQDKLTYTLADTDESGNFDIDRMTGQISVAKGAEFDILADDGVITIIESRPGRTATQSRLSPLTRRACQPRTRQMC